MVYPISVSEQGLDILIGVFRLSRGMLPETNQSVTIANKALNLAVLRLAVDAGKAEGSYITVSLHVVKSFLGVEHVVFCVIYQITMLFLLFVKFFLCWLLNFNLSALAAVLNAPD